MTKAILHISKASTLDEDIPIELFLLHMTEVTSVVIPIDENSEMLSTQKWPVINAKVGQTEIINVQQEDWSHPKVVAFLHVETQVIQVKKHCYLHSDISLLVFLITKVKPGHTDQTIIHLLPMYIINGIIPLL